METESKNIAVSGYYGFDNFGDEAILKVLTSELKKHDFSITVFSKNPSKTAENLGVDASYTFNLKGILKTLRNSDILISGGGSLLQDVTSVKSLIYYLFVISAALMMKKGVVVFAQGIGPIKNPICRFFTQLCLRKCKYVTVRDLKSKELLESWNIEAKLVSDPVWNIELKKRVQTETKNVGVQLRNWGSLSSAYLEKLANAVVKNFSDHKIIIYSLQDSLDMSVCEEFAQIIKHISPNTQTEVVKALSVDETVELFSNLDYMIAMRYHACLLALKYGIPTMALSYDTKVEKLAAAFEIPCSFLKEKENLDGMVECLKSVDTNRIVEEANDRKLDFSTFIKVI